jgi:hypothetical protein
MCRLLKLRKKDARGFRGLMRLADWVGEVRSRPVTAFTDESGEPPADGYDVMVLDRIVTTVAREIRLLEQALKATNAKTSIDGYDQDDAVLGELA